MMNTLKWLQQRQSCPFLTAPAPNSEQINEALQAALAAPDHANLKPQQFRFIQGQSLIAFGDALAEIKAEQGALDSEIEKARTMPLRAPLIIAIAARIKNHPKVPAEEQEYCAATATLMMQLAFEAQGFGSMWRTGWLLNHPKVMQLLQFQPDWKLISILYVGTKEREKNPRIQTPADEQISYLQPEDFK